MTDKNTLDLARVFAESVESRPSAYDEQVRAAAELISSLPDQWIDANKVREVIAKWEGREITSDAHLLYREVEALLPDPTPGTLADMAPAERAACVGRWADDGDDLGIIGRIYDSGTAQLIFPDTYQAGGRPLHAVTPRPDLPRAWTPDGEPVPGEWQYHPAYTGVYQNGTTSLNLIGVPTCSKQDAEWQCADIHRDEPAVRFFLVRRHVTDWEEA